MEGWVMVYATASQTDFELMKVLLEQNDIEVKVVSDKDRVIRSIGDFNIYVHPDNVIKAKRVIGK